MKVWQLIAKLVRMPWRAEVEVTYDGSFTTTTDHVWLARGGHVCIAQGGDPVYRTDNRPASAPTREESIVWAPPEVDHPPEAL